VTAISLQTKRKFVGVGNAIILLSFCDFYSPSCDISFFYNRAFPAVTEKDSSKLPHLPVINYKSTSRSSLKQIKILIDRPLLSSGPTSNAAGHHVGSLRFPQSNRDQTISVGPGLQ
jgi:hypothetical protein